ncbi:DUF4389 domain-containing protein [Microbulbifer flavimaris]|uniref:DUF4389 domain-containing protein n=1 Tax=Microbulbifer flavimaris TaxID=1781068 RepID=A0ABX4I1S9_9GAMM|nr:MULTISPECIES: DUF4389 domain-containing protein [Microbulbifer]KUJ84220.1 glucose-1-phosphate thymidylyltransferase [Microbulbifer sp. ZGT114]PCO06296.1 DUF4389 domain-containing protein [Microbulbifer flavimaris]
MDNEELKKNISSGNQWMRLLYMVLFVILLEIAGVVMLAVIVLQFLFALLTGSANDNLRRLGDQIASYVYQTLQFLIYNSEEKPFPFSEWPESEVEDLSGYESAEEVEGEVVAEAEADESKAGNKDDDKKAKGAGAYVPVELDAEEVEKAAEDVEKESDSKKAGKKSGKKDESGDSDKG